MNTLIQNVNYVVTYTDDIKDALRKQGEEVPAGDGLSTLAGHVRNINKKTLYPEYSLNFDFPYLLPDFENYVTVYDIDGNSIFEEKLRSETSAMVTVNNLIYSNTFYRVNVWSQNINDMFDTFEWFVQGGSYITNEFNEAYFQIRTRGPLYQDLIFSNLTNAFLDSPVHDLSQCNFDNAKDCGQAFRGCVNLNNFVSKLPSATSLYFAFSWCSSLTNLYLDTSNCTNFNNAFRYCENLTSLTINLTKATDVGEMLKGCTKLESFYINGIFGKDTSSDLILDLSETKIGTLENGQIPWNFKQFCLNLETYNGQFNRQFKVTQDLYNEFIQTADYTELQNKNYKLIY